MVARGKIVLVPYPYTYPAVDIKRRPALVIGGSAQFVIIAYITSKFQRGSHIVPLAVTKESRLATKSWVRLDKIVTTEPQHIVGELGTISSTEQKQIHKALRTVLGL